MPARLRELLGDRGPSEPNPESEVEHTVAAPGPESPPSQPPTDDDDEPPIAPPG